MSKTLLVGNFGAKNLGDEMILSNTLELHPNSVVMTSDAETSQMFCETKFETVSFPPTGFRSLLSYWTNRNYRQKVQRLSKLDIRTVIFPGGGLFAIKFQAVWLWFVVFCWLKKLLPQAEFRFEHQGIDQDLSWLSRKLMKRVFAQADFISVRDVSSAEALEKMQIPKSKIKIKEDRVLEHLREKRGERREKQKIVLLNALSNFSFADIKNKYPDYEFKFVCFDPKDQNFVPQDFVGVVVVPKTRTELLNLFSSAEIVIGERLHVLILGLCFCGSKKTFTLKEPYAEKVSSLCEKEGITKF